MIVALYPTRGDAWVIGFTLRVLLKWVDKVLIFHHCPNDCSADDTFAIVRALPPADLDRICMVAESKPEWHEMQHRQKMLEIGRVMGGTHFAMVDSDEFLTANLVGSPIRDMIERLQPRDMLHVPLYNVRNGVGQYHANGLWGNRIVTVAFADHPSLGWGGDKFHSREPENGVPTPPRIQQGDGGVIHLWGASERRLHAKHVAYRLNERIRYPWRDVAAIEADYRQAENDREPMKPAYWRFSKVPADWYAGYERDMEKYLHVDAVPWQEEWNRGVIGAHGRELFAGLSID